MQICFKIILFTILSGWESFFPANLIVLYSKNKKIIAYSIFQVVRQ